jgi:hypothetical protein
MCWPRNLSLSNCDSHPVSFQRVCLTAWHAILQDSLGGDSKALMFCNLAPQPLHVSETLSSLAFASKVSSVVLKTPMRRVEEAREEEAPPDGTPSTPNLASRVTPRSTRQSSLMYRQPQ